MGMSFAINKVMNENGKRPTKRAPDAGDSAAISSSFHALAFFWLDGFAVPAPAQVTQTVGTPLAQQVYFFKR